MIRFLALVVFLCCSSLSFGAWTDFYIDPSGSNLNAGSTTATTAVYTSTGGDSDGTSIFTPADGSTPASSVSVGDFGSVYVTAGATVATFIGRVTAVAAGVNGAITFSTTAKSGTFPAASAGAHTITCQIGGAWKGPNAAVGFPFGFITNALTNSSLNHPCVNLKAGTYSITAAMTHNNAGPVMFCGYTTTPRDGGRAVIDGGTTGASYILLSTSSDSLFLQDIDWRNNGATGSADGTLITGSRTVIFRCTWSGMRRHGLNSQANMQAESCEFFGNNLSNTSGGFSGVAFAGSGSKLVRCRSHHNTGSNAGGFYLDSSVTLINCIADHNGANGILSNGDVNQSFYSCDLYANGGAGLFFTGGSQSMQSSIVNCAFTKNGGYGIEFRSFGHIGLLLNNAFGSGTEANTSGTTNSVAKFGVFEQGTITLPSGVNPWTNPDNGDFRVTAASASGTGFGFYQQTQRTKALTSISNASPAVFTGDHHCLMAGDKITLTTTGTLPTGLATATDYYVISAGLVQGAAGTFRVSATKGGSAINTTGAGSGTHSFTTTNSGTVGYPDTGAAQKQGTSSGGERSATFVQ